MFRYLKLSDWNMPLAEGFVDWFVGTFFFYWWHRRRHAKDGGSSSIKFIILRRA
jgi:hypothetical protein